MKKLRIAAILMIAVMAMFAFAGCGTGEADPDEDESAARTDFSALANFTASTLDGKKFTQDDLAKADLTIINVWSTTCEPCTEELPQLAAFGKSLPDNVKLITYGRLRWRYTDARRRRSGDFHQGDPVYPDYDLCRQQRQSGLRGHHRGGR